MWNSKPVAALFGGSQVVEGDAAYDMARSLGRLLARAGFAICNGGYAGTMEASARGAAEMDGTAVGLTLKAFGGNKSANPFLAHVIEGATMFERLSNFLELADAFIVLPGGVGTLAELFTTWNLIQTRQLTHKPFILIGDQWAETIEHLSRNTAIRDKDVKLLNFVSTPEEAVAILKERVGK